MIILDDHVFKYYIKIRIKIIIFFSFLTITTKTKMNSNEIELTKLILDYSINVKNYAKWFEIADVNKNEDSFTTYKVIYRVYMKITELLFFLVNF